jgi:hypothetical protein
VFMDDNCTVPAAMPTPAAAKPGKSRVFLDSHHLFTLIASYNIHFGTHSNGRAKVTQVIPSAV